MSTSCEVEIYIKNNFENIYPGTSRHNLTPVKNFFSESICSSYSWIESLRHFSWPVLYYFLHSCYRGTPAIRVLFARSLQYPYNESITVYLIRFPSNNFSFESVDFGSFLYVVILEYLKWKNLPIYFANLFLSLNFSTRGNTFLFRVMLDLISNFTYVRVFEKVNNQHAFLSKQWGKTKEEG